MSEVSAHFASGYRKALYHLWMVKGRKQIAKIYCSRNERFQRLCKKAPRGSLWIG